MTALPPPGRDAVGVSVIIPSYNCAAFVAEAVESVLRQSFPASEIILVDDGSTDGTPEVLAPYRDRIRYVRQDNQGVSAARNRGVREAGGELIAFLDADDLWQPDKLERQVEALARMPGAAMVFSDGRAFGAPDAPTGSLLSRRAREWMVQHPAGAGDAALGDLTPVLWFENCVCSTSSVVVRRACLDAVGGFDPGLSMAEDYDAWIRIAVRWPIAVLDRDLFRYRWRESSLSGAPARRDLLWSEGRLRVLERHLDRAPAPLQPVLHRRMAGEYYHCARIRFAADEFAAARPLLLGSLRHRPGFLPPAVFLAATVMGRPAVRAARGAWRVLRRRGGSPAPTRRTLCFVTQTRVRGGTEKHLLDLVHAVDAGRWHCRILCLGDDVFSAALAPGWRGAAAVETVAPPRGYLGFRSLFRRHAPDVIVFVNGELGLFPWKGYLAARMTGGARVVGIEHLIAEPLPPDPASAPAPLRLLRRGIGWRARKLRRLRRSGWLSHRTICVSEAVRQRLVEDYGFPAARTLAIPNGVDSDRFHPDEEAGRRARLELQLPTGPPVVVSVASLVAQKRVDILLEAVAALAREGFRVTCLVVGDGPLRGALAQQAEALGIAASVRFIGPVEDVRPYLWAADLFALASDREGLPLALLEALATGLPCVVTDAGGNREVVAGRGVGLLVARGSSQKFAEALRHALAHLEEARAWGRNAARLVREQWRLDESMRRLAEVICAP